MQMLTRTLVAATALALTAGSATVARAQAKAPVNFSGTWEMDAAKSQFGPLPPPSKMSLTITQTGATAMKVTTVSTTTEGDQSVTSEYTIDGTPRDMKTSDGQPQTSAVKWDGGVLVVDTKMERQGTPIGLASRYALSPDGKLLTIDRHITTPMGDADMRILFNKK
jgi:hypothetical protein